MNFNLLQNESLQIDSIIKTITAIVQQLLNSQDHVTIAVSGGKSPITLFQKLSKTNLPWDKINITLVDERVTDTNSLDSNENLVRTHLLQNNAIRAKFLGLISPEKNMAKMVTYANKWVNQIDIAVLGMGEDGHTASIFPDCPEFSVAVDKTESASYIETNPISAKYKRIGLNLKALSEIKYLILSISGEIKLKVVQEAAKYENANYPVSYLIKQRPDMQIIVVE